MYVSVYSGSGGAPGVIREGFVHGMGAVCMGTVYTRQYNMYVCVSGLQSVPAVVGLQTVSSMRCRFVWIEYYE